MRVTCAKMFKRRHLKIKMIFIYFCKHYKERYRFNVLRIISTLYHIYIESEVLKLAYGNQHNYNPQKECLTKK